MDSETAESFDGLRETCGDNPDIANLIDLAQTQIRFLDRLAVRKLKGTITREGNEIGSHMVEITEMCVKLIMKVGISWTERKGGNIEPTNLN